MSKVKAANSLTMCYFPSILYHTTSEVPKMFYISEACERNHASWLTRYFLMKQILSPCYKILPIFLGNICD